MLKTGYPLWNQQSSESQQVFPNINDIHYVKKEESIRFDMKLDDSKINLISNEDLSGNPWLKDLNDRFRIADRLKNAFPEAKIISNSSPPIKFSTQAEEKIGSSVKNFHFSSPF